MLRGTRCLCSAAKAAAAVGLQTSTSTTRVLRTPLIKFVGKRSKIVTPKMAIFKAQASSPVIQAGNPSPAQRIVKIGSGVDFATLKGKAMFGRPAISVKEIEAIASGGAMDF